MTTVIAVLVVVVLLGLMAFAGFRDGVFFSTYALLRNVVAFLCAMTFREPFARLLENIFSDTHPAHDYFMLISFAAILGIVFVLGRWLKVRYTVPNVPCPSLVDQIGGPITGFVNGIVVTGSLLILWSMLPFAKYLPADYGHIHIKADLLDTGAIMLKYYSHAEHTMGGAAVFLLHDERIQDDLNNNGRADLGEGFYDTNRNGEWDRGWLWKYRNHATIDPTALEPLPALTDQ